jgi:hypothetical protein
MAAFDPKAFGQELSVIVREFVERETAPLRQRLEELEARAMSYQGVHQRAQAYQRGDAVTCNGGLWVAVTNAREGEVPGQSSVWQLAAKGGPR